MPNARVYVSLSPDVEGRAVPSTCARSSSLAPGRRPRALPLLRAAARLYQDASPVQGQAPARVKRA